MNTLIQMVKWFYYEENLGLNVVFMVNDINNQLRIRFGTAKSFTD